jgi:hypothetical protein
MSSLHESQQAFHRGTAPIFALLTPEQTQKLAQLQCDSSTVDRMTELAEKSNEGELSAAERTEYEAYIEANNLLGVLHAEARFHLARQES